MHALTSATKTEAICVLFTATPPTSRKVLGTQQALVNEDFTESAPESPEVQVTEGTEAKGDLRNLPETTQLGSNINI